MSTFSDNVCIYLTKYNISRFMWLMGLSLSVSLKKKLRHAIPRRQLIFSVIRRSILLIFLGCMLNSHGKTETLASIRYPGILQRIGTSYLIVGVIEASIAKRTFVIIENRFLAMFQDIIESLGQWFIMFVLLTTHLLITFKLDVPHCGRGYLGPGGLQDFGKHENCTGGAAGYIDRTIFNDHMYTTPTCRKIYKTTVDYDPEGNATFYLTSSFSSLIANFVGILGTFTCIFLVYMGVQAGRILYTYANVRGKMIRWFVWGFVFVSHSTERN